MLVDHEIRAAIDAGDIVITPDDNLATRIQPASLDVRLADTYLTLATGHIGVIDTKTDTAQHWDTHQGAEFFVPPGQLILAATLECVQLADTILARVEGKSSLGRLGVLVHATAGYIDPGWPLAQITLEISIVAPVPVKLYSGMPIAQLAFDRVSPVASGYCGKYSHQDGPQVSRYHQNWLGNHWT